MISTMLKYKAENDGKIYQEVDRFFPSSKLCNVCLNRVCSLPLDVRIRLVKNAIQNTIEMLMPQSIFAMKDYEF